VHSFDEFGTINSSTFLARQSCVEIFCHNATPDVARQDRLSVINFGSLSIGANGHECGGAVRASVLS
jgi:hypothetical protein